MRAFAKSLRGPLFGPLVLTGMRILGMSPGSVLRWADRGWQMAFRHCGRLHGEVLAPNVGRLTYLELPSICTKSDAWLDSAQGSAYGVFDLCEVDGIVRIDKRARASGRMQLDLEWAEQMLRRSLAPLGGGRFQENPSPRGNAEMYRAVIGVLFTTQDPYVTHHKT